MFEQGRQAGQRTTQERARRERSTPELEADLLVGEAQHSSHQDHASPVLGQREEGALHALELLAGRGVTAGREEGGELLAEFLGFRGLVPGAATRDLALERSPIAPPEARAVADLALGTAQEPLAEARLAAILELLQVFQRLPDDRLHQVEAGLALTQALAQP